jgi:FHS family Na+ dependent glucose MFS transporter 1
MSQTPTWRTAFSRTSPFAKAAAYYAAFVALGLFGASMGPTLPYLAQHTGSRLSEISFLFTARALGYLLGSLVSGRLYDRLPGHRVLAGVLLLMAAMMAIVPTVSVLWLLAIVLLILGLGEGGLDVGGNALLVWVYQDRVSPFMNALHFFFGLGAFVSPIIIAFAIQASGDVTWAYWALALLMLPPLLWIIRLPSPKPMVVTEAHRSGGANRVLLALLVLSFFVYVGAELSFGGWIYTYALTLELGTATSAAYLTSLFWGALMLGRLVSIPLAMRYPPTTILPVDLIGCLAAMSIILLWPESAVALWVGTFGAGFMMASIFPTMISLAERYMTITGQVTSLFLAGSSIGSMTLPWLIGQLFEPVGPWVTMAVISASLVLELALYLLIRTYVARRNAQPAY